MINYRIQLNNLAICSGIQQKRSRISHLATQIETKRQSASHSGSFVKQKIIKLGAITRKTFKMTQINKQKKNRKKNQ